MPKYIDMLFADAPEQAASSTKYNDMLLGSQEEDLMTRAQRGEVPSIGQESPGFTESNTLIENLMTGAGKGLAGIPSAPRTVMDVVKSGEQAIAEKIPGFRVPAATPVGMALAVKDMWPTFEETHGLLTGLGWDNKKANTMADKYEQSIGEFMAGNPSAKARTAVGNIASSLLSETGGQLSEGSKYEWLSRVFGALAGGAATEGVGALRSTTAQVLQKRLEGVPESEFQAAKTLQKQSQELGVPLTGAEAIESSSLQKLAGDISASPYGQPIMDKAFRERPAQVQTAVDRMKEGVAPEVIPQEVAAKATQAATRSIRGAEKARSEATRPLYEAAKVVQVPKKDINPLLTQITKESLSTTNPALKSELASLKSQIQESKGNLGMLNSIRKDFRDRVETPPFGAQALSKEASSKITPILIQIDDVLTKSSDAYAEANTLYARISKEVVDPLMASGIGKIAGKGFDPQATQNINNALSVLTDVNSARPSTINQVATELGRVDKTVFPSMVRVVLDNSFDKASKELLSGENRNIGALFVKNIYGTPQQKKNFEAMIKQSAISNGNNPNLAWKGTETLMEILKRTGRIPGAGSATAPRQQLNTELAASKLAATGDIISTSPLSSISRGLRNWQEAGRYRELAKILTDKDSVNKIEQLARTRPDTRKARFLASQLLQVSRESAKQDLEE